MIPSEFKNDLQTKSFLFNAFIPTDQYFDRVILGSFSNYLVTKSSVPVMVARKKLRKHSKYKRPVKLANNLTAGGRGLMAARVDEFVR